MRILLYLFVCILTINFKNYSIDLVHRSKLSENVSSEENRPMNHWFDETYNYWKSIDTDQQSKISLDNLNDKKDDKNLIHSKEEYIGLSKQEITEFLDGLDDKSLKSFMGLCFFLITFWIYWIN